MKASPATVFDLFDVDRRYIVPLFQRPYVWNRDQQWNPLWADIVQKAEDYLDLEKDQHDINKHFLGAIVLNPIRTSGFQVNSRLIVDGQQRLTTLQIILIALRDFSKIVGHEELLHDLQDNIANDCRMEQSFEVYKVWPTNADQSSYEAIYQAGSPKALEILFPYEPKKANRNLEYRPRLVEAYLFFFHQIEDFAFNRSNGNSLTIENDAKEIYYRLDALEQAFKRSLEIVVIDLDEHDNPQVIFESLNYRGVPLTASDLIRNFIFLEITNQGKPVEDFYHEYWEEFDIKDRKSNQYFWKLQEKAGRYFVPRMDLYIFNYLTLKTGKDISLGRLYQEFLEYWKNNSCKVDVELGEISRFRPVFQELYQPDMETRRGMFERRVRILDVSTIYPLLLYLFEEKREEISTKEMDGIVTDLESYLVRRLVCDLSTKNYNRTFQSLLSELRKLSIVNRNTIQSLLRQSTSETSRWPDDEEFFNGWISKPAYINMRHRVRVILEALDRSMKTSKQEDVIVDYGKATIEHLLPQGWHEHYPIKVGKMEERDAIVNRETMLHTIGNLTFLTQPLNSAVSNGPFKDKRPKIAAQSLLKMNSYFQTCGDQWDEDSILKRGKELFGIAKVIWPYPGS